MTDGNGRRVMIVEDDDDVAEILGLMAQSLGHRVEWAPTGGLAVSMLPSFDPEVVFVDLGLPDIDGFEVARRIREKAERRRPVLSALTGWIDFKAWEGAATAGFDHYLVKPATRLDLERIIRLKPPSAERRRRADLPR